MHTDYAIIGGGLSGLSLARHLETAGADYQLFEARARFGGRILSPSNLDLGPSWFWPGQPRMTQLAQELELRVFDQYATGALTYEPQSGPVIRNQGFSSMQGSLRIKGGMGALVSALIHHLPHEKLHSDHIATKVEKGVVFFANGRQCRAKHIVLAMPPRLIAELECYPPLPIDTRNSLKDIPTWMAGHAKLVAVYDTPFWRDAGLSGDAMSQVGPLVEIHDTSPIDQPQGALFGFVGIPAQSRNSQDAAIKSAAIDQLARLFGPQALTPIDVHYQDWIEEPFTATSDDLQPVPYHPNYGLQETLAKLHDGTLHICSTEVSPQMGGYLEGALAASEYAFKTLMIERTAP